MDRKETKPVLVFIILKKSYTLSHV